ncbi:MAG: aminotransferase class I/II-fold pyridoxal phosphate-dependent enzyme [Alphaproteobacteria bacterium]|nr:aminotransferase class I/II-fold pyridoxal phosphate-dependent enzyme [Alphaproteobacteria bacterium]MBF0130625.1 aminotransferase class I/II-fold pyridoxal phosphate-dependent enzyme [Alphaproteobacteria bacterium]
MLNDRLDQLTDYPFDRLRALLDPITPPPVSPLVMSIGEPQHAAPSFLREVLDANAALWNRYPPTNGTPAFRSAVVDWLNRRFHLPAGMLDADRHVLPVAGTREALYAIADLVVPRRKSGGKAAVLIPNPFYQVYLGAALMAGAEAVFLQAGESTGFLPDFSPLEPAASNDTMFDPYVLDRTALAYLCSPANPQGAIMGADALERAIRLARRHDFVLAVDECYSEIYDRDPPVGALEVCARMGGDLGNVLVFHSLSKRSSVPGLRSGFVAGDPALIAAFARLRAYGGAVTPLPVLTAATVLWRDEDHVDRSRSLYRAKIDAAERILGGRFGFRRPPGSFFLWLKVGDGEEAAKALWREAAIRVLPGAYLARPTANGVNPGAGYIRVALVHDQETTEAALRRIRDIL